jgi:hypothetical protein
MFGSFTKNAVALGAALFVFGAASRADEFQPLDARQSEIANAVVDKVIERIKALKPRYPELAEFGEKPYFTRADGEFRYDYKTEKVVVGGEPQARAFPGGCGIYYRVYALGAPESKWFRYYKWTSIGGLRAGITRELSVTVFQKDDQNETITPLIDEIRNAEEEEWDTTAARLTSEYLLAKKGIAVDTPSLLDAAENHDADIASDALTVLRFRVLTPGQIARIRESFHNGKIPIIAGQSVIEIVDKQAHAALPAFLSDAVMVSLQNEKAGKDTFQRTPAFDQPWESHCRILREIILSTLKDGDPLDIDPGERILSSDTDLRNRLNALDYIARQRGDSAQKLVIEALHNSYRSVQVKAAGIAGEKKLAIAGDALRLLLSSSSSRVRTAAADALRQLGQAVPDPVPIPPLPDSAREIAAALWRNGLRDEDLLVVHVLPLPDPLDARLMPAVDRDSVEKAATAYAHPDPKGPFGIHKYPPGPFLLAAAMNLKDQDSARLVYGRMCDIYETDDEAMEDGMNNLGWDRFSVALDQFHQKNDDAAALHFEEVIAFANVARPFTRLGTYVKQSDELLRYLKTKPQEKASSIPERSDTAAYVHYWIGQLKDCDGSHPSEAGEKIREMGLAAVPFLIDALVDHTPTRNFRYGRSYLTYRDIVYVGDAAKNIIGIISEDYCLDPPIEQFDESTPLELQEKLRGWLKKVPADSKPISPERRDPRSLYPAGEYYSGDD